MTLGVLVHGTVFSVLIFIVLLNPIIVSITCRVTAFASVGSRFICAPDGKPVLERQPWP
jgi:hypothetical protein